jgi:hypothetical protein
VKLFFGEDKVPTHREVKVGLSSVDGSMAAYFSFNNSPSIFKAASADLSPFILTADSFRDRALMPVTLDEIQSIKASGSKVDPVEILATEKDWTVNGKRSDPVFAEQYLTDLTSLQIAEFPTKGGEHAFDNPFLTLVVTKKGEQKEQVTLVIGDEVITRSGTRRFARIGTDGEPVLITDLDAKRIVPHEEALVEAATPTPAVTSREAAPQRDPHDAGASKP